MGVRTPGTAPFLVPTLAVPAGCWGGCNTGAGKVSTFQSRSRVLVQPGMNTGICWRAEGTITVLAPWPEPESCLLVLGEGFLGGRAGDAAQCHRVSALTHRAVTSPASFQPFMGPAAHPQLRLCLEHNGIFIGRVSPEGCCEQEMSSNSGS